MNIKERVQAGINYLNENHPGWHHHINLDIFDWNEYDMCVVGQLYDSNILADDIYDNDMPELGFDLNNTDDLSIAPKLFEEEWRERIEELQNV